MKVIVVGKHVQIKGINLNCLVTLLDATQQFELVSNKRIYMLQTIVIPNNYIICTISIYNKMADEIILWEGYTYQYRRK